MKKLLKLSLILTNILLFTTSIVYSQEYQTIFPAHMMVTVPCVNNDTKLINDQTTLGSLHHGSAYYGGRLVLVLNQQLCPLISFARTTEESQFFVSSSVAGDNLYCTNITPQIKKVLDNKERYGYTPELLGAALLKADQKALSDTQLPMFNNIITQIPVPYAIQVPTPVYVQVPGPTVLIPQPVYVPAPAPIENSMTHSDQQIINTQLVSVPEQPQHIESSAIETHIKTKEESTEQKIEKFAQHLVEKAKNNALTQLKEEKTHKEKEARKKRKKAKEAAAKEAAAQIETTNFIVQMFNEPINTTLLESKNSSFKDQKDKKMMSKPMTESQIKEQDEKELTAKKAEHDQLQKEENADDEEVIDLKTAKPKAKKTKKLKHNASNNTINNNDNDTFEETFSKDEITQLIADTATYSIITHNIINGAEFNEKTFPQLIHQVNRFFNYARKSNDPEIIKFLDTIFKESLIQHAQTSFPDNKRIDFCYSAAILYCLYLIDTINRKKDTLSLDETLKLLYDFETHCTLQYALLHQKDEYSGETVMITINTHHKNLIQEAHKKSLLKMYKKELDQFAIEQEYIHQHVKEIAHCALQCLPTIIETTLPAIIDRLIKTPRSKVESYKEYSGQVEELICNIMTLIRCISLEYKTEAKRFKSTVQKIKHEHKVLTIMIKDHAFNHINNFINGTTIPTAKPTNTQELNDLFLRYFTERLDGQPILNLLNELKCGVYGDLLSLLDNIETAVPLNTLFSLPEMEYSRKILITAFILKHNNSFEKRRYLDYLTTVTENFHKKTLANLQKNLLDK